MAASSLQVFKSGRIGDNPQVRVYGGEIIVADDLDGGKLGPVRTLTYNDAYMVIMRNIWEQFDPNYKKTPDDKAMFDQVRKDISHYKRHPVSELQNVPFFDELEAKPAQAPANVTTQDFIAAVQNAMHNNSRLIETEPGAENHNYIDTVKEGEMLAALISTGNMQAIKIAEDILFNYNGKDRIFSFWDQTRQGTVPVTNFYNAETGSPLRKDPDFKNSAVSLITAEAQISIANAYYKLWQTTINPDVKMKAQVAMVNLVNGLMTKFYPEYNNKAFGAFSEQVFDKNYNVSFLTFQGRGAIFYTKTNAKASLLLNSLVNASREMTRLVAASSKDEQQKIDNFNKEVLKKKQNLEQFINDRLMKRVRKENGVPYAIYENKDWATTQSTLGEVLWSDADAWMYFIEAARVIKDNQNHPLVDDNKAVDLLKTMANAHGAVIGQNAGIDASISPRSRVIFAEATINALRVSKLVGYQHGVDSLSAAIAQYPHNGNLIPELVGADPAKYTGEKGLDTGLISHVYPVANGRNWSYSPVTVTDLMLAQQGGDSVYNLAVKNATQKEAFILPLEHSLSGTIIAVGILGIILLLPFINLLTGLITKRLLIVKAFFFFGPATQNVRVEMQDIDQAYADIRNTIELTDDRGRRITVPAGSRTRALRGSIHGERSPGYPGCTGIHCLDNFVEVCPKNKQVDHFRCGHKRNYRALVENILPRI